MTEVKISGPVSLCILHDKVRDRYFYIFGDQHFSMDLNCSRIQPGLRTDRPSFDYRGVITTNSNAWTISALIHEVLNANGKKGIRTDYYREVGFISSDYDYKPSNLEEYLLRQNGIYKEPKSRSDVEQTKERLEKGMFGWMDDAELLIFNKKYRKEAQVINADCRLFNDEIIVPCFHPLEEVDFVNRFPAAVKLFMTQGNEQEYLYKMNELFLSLEEYVILLEQIAGDPYQFLKYFFEVESYADSTRRLIEYLPHESELMKKLIARLYKSIDDGIGVNTKSGRISPSAASVLKLQERQPDLAVVLEDFVKQELQRLAESFHESINEVSTLLYIDAFTNPENIDIILDFIPRMEHLCKLSVQLGTYVMDVYVLSETLLRNAQHNIYFVGDKHARNYIKFLNRHLGYEVLERIKADADGTRCVTSVLIADLLQLHQARELLYV